MLFVATALSGAFGGLIAYGVLQMNGISGVAGWRWLFYIEGIISFVVGIAVFFLLPSSPDKAYFLSQAEKDLCRRRLAQNPHYVDGDQLSWKEIRKAFLSPICWMSAAIQIGGDVCLYGFSTFLPTIIEGMGYASLSIQYFTIPVYIWGALVYTCVAFFAERFRHRAFYMLFFGCFTMAGYIILICSKTIGVLYFAVFMCTTGMYVIGGLNMTWLAGNTAGMYKRATAIGMNQCIGNSGGTIAGQIYMASDAPRYVKGNAISLGCYGWAMFWTCAMYLTLRRRNAEKARRLAAGEEDHDENLGDASLHFKYYL